VRPTNTCAPQGSRGGLAATMEAAKEKETAFRRRFEATAGESGARAAVLGYRPAVREAAQRNTAPSDKAPTAASCSTTPPRSPGTAGLSPGMGAGGATGPRTQDFGGKPWAQLSWSARLAACRGVEEAAKEAVLQLGPRIVALAKKRVAEHREEWEELSWTERLEVCIEGGAAAAAAAGNADPASPVSVASAPSSTPTDTPAASTPSSAGGESGAGERDERGEKGSRKASHGIVPKFGPRGASGHGGGGRTPRGEGEGAKGGGTRGSLALGARLVPSVIVDGNNTEHGVLAITGVDPESACGMAGLQACRPIASQLS